MSYFSKFFNFCANKAISLYNLVASSLSGSTHEEVVANPPLLDLEVKKSPILINDDALTAELILSSEKNEPPAGELYDKTLEVLLNWDKQKKPQSDRKSLSGRGRKKMQSRSSQKKWQMVRELIPKKIKDELRFYAAMKKGAREKLKLRFINRKPSQPTPQKRRTNLAELYRSLTQKLPGRVDSDMAQKWREAACRIVGPYIEHNDDFAWFDDTTIDLYLRLLASKCLQDNKRIVTLPAGYYRAKLFIEEIRKAGEREGGKRQLCEQLKAADAILWPFSYSGSMSDASGDHWGLLIIEKVKSADGSPLNSFHLQTVDGFNLRELHTLAVKKGTELLAALHKGELQIKSTQCLIPPQSNTQDCGPVICHFAKAYCQGEFEDRKILTHFEQYKESVCNYKHVRIQVLEALAVFAKTLEGNQIGNEGLMR